MRLLPNLLVVAPGDPVETRHATRALVEHPGPCYLRLGKSGEPVVHKGEIEFELGKAIQVRNGSDVTLMSTGGMLYNAVTAAERLEAQGVHARVLSMHTLKPLDIEAVRSAAADTGAIVTIEEHSISGGLGSAVAEVLAETDDVRSRFKRLGVPAHFAPRVGSQEYLLAEHGLTPEQIADSVKDFVNTRAATTAGA
jgi:transketolase